MENIQPSYLFSGKENRNPVNISEELGNLSVGAEPEAESIPSQIYESNDVDLLGTSEKEEIRGPVNTSSAYKAPEFDVKVNTAIDDLLGLGLLAAPPLPPPLTLNPKASLDPGSFQRKWGQLAISSSQVLILILCSYFQLFYCEKSSTLNCLCFRSSS